MAYEKKSVKVLAGGINILLPPDLIDDSESQELLNFHTDSAGSLRSRRGHSVAFSTGSGQRVVAMIQALGKRWAVTGGTAYADGVPIVNGLSADRVGIAAFKDFVWLMSKDAQRKSDGVNDWRWLPAKPTVKPTTKPATEVVTQVVNFTGGWTVDPAGDENYNVSASNPDGDLQIVAQSANEYTITKLFSSPLDLKTGFSLDDIHRLRIFCHQWLKVIGMTVQLDFDDQTFTKNYVEAPFKQSDIQAGFRDTITFQIRKRPQQVDIAATDKKRYGWFNRIGQDADKDWNHVVAARIKFALDDSTKLRFEAWDNIGNADATIEGDDIQHYMTFTTAAEHESNPSPVSDPITVNRGAVDLSALEVSADPQVTFKNIYRTGGTLGHVYRIKNNTVANASTTATDIYSDDNLTDLGIQLEDDHDDPPAVSGLIGDYYDRLIAFGGQKAYWTKTNKPHAFSGPDLLDGNWLAVSEDVGELLAATKRPGILFLYGTKRVRIIQGDPGDGINTSAHTASIQMGVKSPTGVVQTDQGDFANMSEGIYGFNGDSAGPPISKKIEPVFKTLTPLWDPTKAALGFRNNVLWASDGTYMFKFDLLTARWFQDSRVFSCFYSDDDQLLGGTPTGDVLMLDQGFSDAGVAIPLAWKSKAYDCGILDNEKTFEDFTVWAKTGAATLTVTAYLNDGQDDQFTVVLGTISSTSRQRFVLKFNPNIEDIPANDEDAIKARTCAIRVTGNCSTTAECRLDEMALNYYVEAREAKTFDSDERDFGTSKAKIIRKVQVDLHSPAPVQFILQTDQPGFEMATRDSSHQFAISTTRREDLYVLPVDQIAHNARFLLSGDDFRHYGMRALIQIIGTLIHGSKGDFYDSDTLDSGEERVKLYHEIECLYASDKEASLRFYTELPSGSLAEIAGSPFLLPATGGLGTISLHTHKIQLPNYIKGRLKKARIEPVGDLRLEALRDFEKLVGLPGATGWSWVSFPIEPTSPAPGVWQDVWIEADAIG